MDHSDFSYSVRLLELPNNIIYDFYDFVFVAVVAISLLFLCYCSTVIDMHICLCCLALATRLLTQDLN
jgi:hypothetical protein